MLAGSRFLLGIMRLAKNAHTYSVEDGDESTSKCSGAWQAMEIDAILASDATVDKGGVRTITEHGEAVYDLRVLTEVLRQRCLTAAEIHPLVCITK